MQTRVRSARVCSPLFYFVIVVFARVHERPDAPQFIDVSDEIPQFLTSPRNSAIYILKASVRDAIVVSSPGRAEDDFCTQL
jgi:hypothetical protein